MNNEIVKFSVTDAAIAVMNSEYLPLIINGIEDKAGYLAVRGARLTVKSKRCDIENTRKELKEESIAWGRKVDAEARRITELLAPIEKHLSDEQDRIDKEKEAIREAAEKARREKLNERVMQLQAVDVEIQDIQAIEMMNDSDFSASLSGLTFTYMKNKAEKEAAEALKLKEEQEARELMQAQLEANIAEAERLSKIDEAQKIANEALEYARIFLEKDRLQRERSIEIEKERLDAAEKSRIDTELRIKREEQERISEEIALNAAKPDREKLLDFAALILSIEFPVCENIKAIKYLKLFSDRLSDESKSIRNFAIRLHKTGE